MPVNLVIGKALKFIILLATALSVLLPFWMLFISSLRDRAVLFEHPPRLWPANASLDNYVNLLERESFLVWFQNSFNVSFFGTLFMVLVCVPCGYAFAKKDFPLKTLLFLMILATMMIPPTVTLFPSFVIARELGLVDTATGMYITGVASVFGMFLMKQYMEGVPDQILQSAKIDGAGEYRTFLQIVVPLSKPAVAMLVIWGFMAHWNNLLWPLIISRRDATRTLPVGIASFSTQDGVHWHIVMAATVLSFIPVLIVFLIFRRQFIAGLTEGAVKG